MSRGVHKHVNTGLRGFGTVGTAAVLSAVLALGGAGGCAERRVVARRGLLAGLPGSQSQIPAQGARSAPRREGEAEAPAFRLRVEDEQGNITLVSRSVRDVMVHVVATLMNNEEELFMTQVLSDVTRQEFVALGHDPVWAFRELKRRERDVRRLYNAMPFGEYTPGLFLKKEGKNVFRLRVRSTGDLPWSFVDVVIEDGSWRLRWFGS